MEYKVVPIIPTLKQDQTINHIALDFESVIQKYAAEGWQYQRVESLQIWVDGSDGCFGLGATPGYHVVKQMIVFKK